MSWTKLQNASGLQDDAVRQTRLICSSHLRWNFVYQRPQHLLSRATADCNVYFIEEPVFAASGEPRLSAERTKDNVTVIVPTLPAGCSAAEAVRYQRELITAYFARLGPAQTILWYYTPMALPFS